MVRFSADHLWSLVESEHPVAEGDPEGAYTGNRPEATMVLGTPFPDVLMSTVAERSIRWHLAVAELVVAGLGDIKSHGSAPRQNPLALTVAHWVHLTMSATAPVVWFSTVQEHVRGEDTCVCRHARRSVTTLFIGPGLSKVSHCLSGEVCHVVHGLDSSLNSRRFKNDGVWKHNITVVGHHFTARGTIRNK